MQHPFIMKNNLEKQPEPATAKGYWFILHNQKLVMSKGSNTVPLGEVPEECQLQLDNRYFLGNYKGKSCYCGDLRDIRQLPGGLELVSLRSLLGILDADMFTIAGRAMQLNNWRTTHRFCGKCGKPTIYDHSEEFSTICTDCNISFYPRISPVVIMSVVDGNRILLARSPRFRTGIFSTLAGFVEPGETLEEAVAREVHEEVNVKVKDIRYVASQPWPFPHSLMMGFQTTYAGGRIVIDNKEIEDAGWFSARDLPAIPIQGTIARHLIQQFLDESAVGQSLPASFPNQRDSG